MNSKSQIIATIGPASRDKNILREMILHQMDVARLNFSWASTKEHAENIATIRELEKEIGRKIIIIQDLSGPRVQKEDSHQYNALAVETITEKDLSDLDFGLKAGVDYVAMSFVGSAKDIERLRGEIVKRGKDTPIIAKIERRDALTNLSEIIQASDAVLIARGDLRDAIPLEQIPFVQADIIHRCKAAGKPVITATEMLLSMTDHSLPTRAEVTDVANAIIQGSDAVMLSEETARGKYPVEAVKIMERIVLEAERHLGGNAVFDVLK
ncbi:MAG: pyruvate kinase [Candidatus Paceibacterota bacterium]|jgi:pyruvate kinase